MRLPPYTAYKDSGVEWLGYVPESWNTLPLKHIATITTGYAFSSDDFVDEGVPVIRIGDISRDGSVDLSNAKYLPEDYAHSYRGVLVIVGDIVMAMTGATIGKAGRYYYEKPALLNQRVCIFRPSGDNHPGYLWYVLNSGFYTEHINLTAFGGAQPNISDKQLLECSAPKPSVTEQCSIANFLDVQTTKIDVLLAKKRELVDKLKEKRIALISRTVTRGLPADAARAAGLDPHPEMKTSGNDWLDDMPVHWETKRIKYIAYIVGRIGFRGYSTDDLVSEGDGAITLSPSNCIEGKMDYSKCTFLSWDKYYESPEIMVNKDDIIMVKTGSTIGKTAIVDSVPHPMTINPQLMIFKGVKTSNRFLFYYLYSKVIQDLIPLHNTGSTIPTMTQESIGRLPVPIPPISEQEEIASYLDAETQRLDDMVLKVEEAIERLREYRTSLITAAVTGKIDVRGATA